MRTSRILIRDHKQGSALIFVILVLVLSMVAGVTFLGRSNALLMMTGLHTDSKSTQYSLETGHEIAKNKLTRAITGMILNGKLRYVGGPTSETFNNLSNAYAADPLSFLRALVRSQAYSAGGTLNSASEFANFDTAFPTNWTDPDANDGEYYQMKYTFTPVDMVAAVNPQELRFEYEYRVQVRAYGQTRFQSAATEDSGVITVTIRGAPFSQWGAFMHSMLNQNGSTLVFAGGNTSAQIQEVYAGPVHVNMQPNFYGHPIFNDLFTSATAEASWVNYNVSGYSCCAVFNGGKAGSVASISMPTQLFNMQRLAAGDTSNNAATNNAALTNSDLNNFIANHATGTVASSTSAPAPNIYIPIDNPSAKNPTGGVYIEGDARIRLNVVQGVGDFSAGQWAKISGGDRACKFQKIAVTHLTAGVTPRDIYVADDPCNATYVFNAADSSSDPVVLAGRINGNIHVNGKIDQIGGESRTRPAIAQDFSFTFSAQKDVRVVSDLQYEDATYKTLNADGSTGAEVANPYGALNGSGILPTAERLAPTIPSTSRTTLGLVSTQRNVVIHSSAPANINIHAAIFAGNSNPYNSTTGYGCGSAGASTQGCGFGYEGWNTNTGMGSIKFLGSLSEYKDQTTGVLSSPPKGYASIYFYDSRLRQDVTPPAFPVSDSPQVYATVQPYKTWRVSQSSQ